MHFSHSTGTTSGSGNRALETKVLKIKRINECIDKADRILFGDILVY